jgi:hypothetical protein
MIIGYNIILLNTIYTKDKYFKQIFNKKLITYSENGPMKVLTYLHYYFIL